MIDFLTSIIANGTTAWNFGYQPWLPFYNFLPVIAVTTLLILLLVRNVEDAKYAAWFMSSSVWALLPAFMYWRLFKTPPDVVFLNWFVHLLLLFAVNVWYFRWKKTKVIADV